LFKNYNTAQKGASMGKIINGNFSAKNNVPEGVDNSDALGFTGIMDWSPDEVSTEIENLGNQMAVILTEDMSQSVADYFVKSLHVWGALGFKKAFDPSLFERSKIEARQSRLKEKDDEELLLYLHKATDSLVDTYPSFYCALVLEINERNLFQMEE
jgi:hypothetical protein